jgi:hypothetical protein
VKRVRPRPAWRVALLRKGAGVVAKRAHLPLPLVKRIKAGTAKVSARTEQKLFNAHRAIRYHALRRAGVEPRTARRESGIRNVKRAAVRDKLIKAGASDKNVVEYQNAPPAFVNELAARYKDAVKLIWEIAKATRPAKDAPTLGEVAAGIRVSGRIFAISDLERYVAPYQRGQSIETPSGGKRRNVWKLIHNIGRYINEHWEQLGQYDGEYRAIYESARLLDVVAVGNVRWSHVRDAAVELREKCAGERGQEWEAPDETDEDENV